MCTILFFRLGSRPHFPFFWDSLKCWTLAAKVPHPFTYRSRWFQGISRWGVLTVTARRLPVSGCLHHASVRALLATFVLDRGHGLKRLTACCDGSVSDEVTCGSGLRDGPQLLSARSVTSCQLGRVSCQCQLGGDSECWPGSKRVELLNTPLFAS